MIFMISLLTCCKTHQSVIEKSTVIAKDTTAINRIAAKDSTSLNAKIDSIIIEEYAVDRSELTTEGQNDLQNLHGNKKKLHGNKKNVHGNKKNFHGNKKNFHGNKKNLHGNKKRNDTSQSKPGSMKKKTKIYGVNLSGTWLSINDSLNKKMTHQQTTNSEIKQKAPEKDIARGKNIYALIAFAIALFVGYVFWKNAVQ